MKIAVLSGKGGTGKTFLSANLAAVTPNSTYIDCDIEEPNGYLFLKPEEEKTREVSVPVPVFDESKCTGCRKCVRFCRFNALAFIKGKPRLFPEICHSCGGCRLVCPSGAVTETRRRVGVIKSGKGKGGVAVLTGILDSGEATGVSIVHKLMEEAPREGTVLIDCPPGSACSTMESIRTADYCVLAAEPTLFGLDNLELVARLVGLFHKPAGIVINKDIGDSGMIDDFAAEQNLPVLCRIPYSARLAELNAGGALAAEDGEYREMFTRLGTAILEKAGDER